MMSLICHSYRRENEEGLAWVNLAEAIKEFVVCLQNHVIQKEGCQKTQC